MKTNWDGYRDYYHPGPQTEPDVYSFTQVCAGLGIEPNWLLSEHTKLK